MSFFDHCFRDVLMKEGGTSDDPDDSGGATKYGITEAVARANGHFGDMRSLTETEARMIAKRQYWDVQRLDRVAEIYAPVAKELFDTGYNMGIVTAGKMLQRSLNGLNNRQTLYRDIEDDGLIGPMTLYVLGEYRKHRKDPGEKILLKALNGLQLARYFEIAEAREKDEKHLYGWIRQRVEI